MGARQKIALVGHIRGIDEFGQMRFEPLAGARDKLAGIAGGADARTPLYGKYVAVKLTAAVPRKLAEEREGDLVGLRAVVARYRFVGRDGAPVRGWYLRADCLENPYTAR